jgi:hypothetical protein
MNRSIELDPFALEAFRKIAIQPHEDGLTIRAKTGCFAP